MKCPNCSMEEFISLPHKRYILVEYNEQQGRPASGGVPLFADMCKKCGHIRLFHQFKPDN